MLYTSPWPLIAVSTLIGLLFAYAIHIANKGK